jgi:hypothetical protein
MNATLELALEGLPLLDALLLGLASLPIWLGLPILLGCGILITIISSFLISISGSPTATPAGANFLSGAKFGFLGEVFAALLAFVLVDGGIRYSDARQEVRMEAAALKLFDAVVADLSSPETMLLRQELRTYAQAVVESESVSMQLGQESLAARSAFERVLTSYLRVPVRSDQDRLVRLQADQFLTRIQESRQRRLQATRPGLRTLIWGVFLGNTLIAVMFSWLFRARSLAAHIIMATVMTAALMAMVYLAVLLYHPFTGNLTIDLEPFLQLPPL